MSSSDAELAMAYADGELDPLSARRFEKRMEQDAALAEQVARHRRLRATLSDAFPVEPGQGAPDPLAAMIRQSAQVVSLDSARAKRRWRPAPRDWMTGGAVAASLIVGVMLGHGVGQGDVALQGGALVAQAQLGRTLDTQLASAQADDAPVRILVSFQDDGGRYCRAFASASVDGIACKQGGDWRLQTTRPGTLGARTEFRQAGSEDAALLAQAQAMMAGAPMDARAEAAASARGWR